MSARRGTCARQSHMPLRTVVAYDRGPAGEKVQILECGHRATLPAGGAPLPARRRCGQCPATDPVETRRLAMREQKRRKRAGAA